MKVLYHIGESIGPQTIVKKGIINETQRPLTLEAEDKIVFNDLHNVDFFKMNGFGGTVIKLQNGADTLFLVVPRLYINIGSGFAIVNSFATRKLKKILEASQSK